MKKKKETTVEAKPVWLEDLFNYLFETDEFLQNIFKQRKEIITFLVDREKALHGYLAWIIHYHCGGKVTIDAFQLEKYVWQLQEEKDKENDTTTLTVTRTKIPDEES